MSLWRLEEILAVTGGRLVGEAAGAVSGVSIDSRTLAPGDLFVAIAGERHDGHRFVKAAFDAGAALAIVAERRRVGAPGPLVRVPDTLQALEALGAAARARSGARIAAITGSVGKTGTKEALRLALSRSGETHASVKSFNNLWGVPLSLARLPHPARYGVFEAGMNRPGEITPLSRLIRPHVAMVTAVEAVHAEFFPSLEAIADAKAEIFDGLEPDGAAVVPRDTPFFERLAAKARARGAGTVVGFGSGEGAGAQLVDLRLHESCSCVVADICGVRTAYKIGAPGRHLVMNSLAVLAAVHLMGADLALAALALADWHPPEGRGARREIPLGAGVLTVVDESYNANPASMRAAIETLGQSRPQGRGRRIAVLGDMLELGDDAPGLHAGLAKPLADAGVDLVFACGPLMQTLWNELPEARKGAYASTSGELAKPLCEALGPGDIVMIKGSFGSRMGPLVEAILQRFARPGGGVAGAGHED